MTQCHLSRRVFLLASLVLVAASGGAQPPQPPQPTTPKAAKPAKPPRKPPAPSYDPALEPRAVDLLKAACSRLAAARTMAFTAVVTYESPSRLGPPLAYTTKSEVTLQRPDKLRVITSGDGPASEFYYDGKAMMAFEPAQNLVAVAEAPPTIDGALLAAYDNAAIYYPFTDVIVSDPWADLADDLKTAFYIGQSNVVGETTTDMLAFATDTTYVQMWVGAEDKLPRMMRAVYRDDPSQLRHQLELSNWRLDQPVAAEAFGSSAAAGAPRIAFARPDPPPPSPAGKPKPKNSAARTK